MWLAALVSARCPPPYAQPLPQIDNPRSSVSVSCSAARLAFHVHFQRQTVASIVQNATHSAPVLAATGH